MLDCIDDLEARADTLAQAQFEHGLSFPIALEGGACAIVEAWASGEDWAALLSNTSLDGGDIFRILKRSLELLRSIASVPYVSPGVKRRAAEAIRAMNRYPIAENALMGVPGMTDEEAAEQQEAAARG